MQASTHAAADQQAARKLKAEAAECENGKCLDPVVQAGRFAKSEGETTLQATICGFLTEYGGIDLASSVRQNASPVPGAKPYCENMNPALRPKVIVAVLPDPVHTQLALRFDESADELLNSMQDLGWFFDRAWLPWDNKLHEDAADFDERMENRSAQKHYEDSPGALLFRANPGTGQPQPLIVLVVGDTPTGGITAIPFRKAIEIWQGLTGWDQYIKGTNDPQHPSDAATLSILGPTFSGSTPSLRGLLREVTLQARGKAIPPSGGDEFSYDCPAKDLHIYVASGTISDADALYDLTGIPEGCNTLHIDPRSMDVDVLYKDRRILQFLYRHGSILPGDRGQQTQIAWLTEAESSFGAAGADAHDTGLESKLPVEDELIQVAIASLEMDGKARAIIASSSDKNAVAAAKKQTLSDEARKNVLQNLIALKYQKQADLNAYQLNQRMAPKHFFFPREISKLRAAYEQNGIFGFNSQANSVRTELHLSLSGSTTEDDTVRTFSGSQEAAVMEAEMAQLAAELERQKITIAVLSATDVLDELFVTRYLNQHAPNVAVIVTDTDVLFLRGGDSSMENAYVIGPWPLIPGNADWSALPDKERIERSEPVGPQVRFHDSAGGQGLYAAARLLVCEAGANPAGLCRAIPNPNKEDTTTPFFRRVLIPEYQPPVATGAAKTNDLKSEPPLWLSAVGRGGFWPISLVDVDQADDGMPESGEYNLPRMLATEYNEDGHEKPLPPVVANGIIESDPLSITLATCILALLLLWHGLACVRARLDRGFAWGYALSDEDHVKRKLVLQAAIALAAIPALVLLKIPIEAGVAIRHWPYTVFNWGIQIVAVLLATWPMLLLFGVRPWPALDKTFRTEAKLCWEKRKEPEFLKRAASLPWWAGFKTLPWRAGCKSLGWFLAAGLTLWVVNKWLWDLIAPGASEWPTERAFFFYRSGHLFCGSSPSLPLLLLGGALVLYMVAAFDRMVFYTHRIPNLPDCDAALRCPGQKTVEKLNDLLSKPWDWLRLGLLVAVAVFLLLLNLGFRNLIPRSLAHGKFDIAIFALSGGVLILLLYDLAMALTTWFLLHSNCLLPLSMSPLRWGFTWIKGWSWRRIWTPGAISPDRAYDYLARVSEANRRAMKDGPLATAFDNLQKQFELSPRNAAWAHKVTAKLGELHRTLAESAKNKLAELQKLWAKDHGPITGYEAPERGLSGEIPLNREFFEKPGDEAKWKAAHDRMAKEEFVALLYLGYIRMVLLQIRNRILTAAAIFVLLLWALTSYPFLNRHYILIGLSCIMGVLATAVIWIYAQMHRDEVLSRTTETQTGKLDADFFVKILSMVGLPLLTLVASQFPEVSNVIFSWLEPGLSSMR
jgi:hypothetical protein